MSTLLKADSEHPARPESGHPLPVQRAATVQNLDALIPARVLVSSSATKRPELYALLRGQRISNYTVYCTLIFYCLQPA